MFYLICNLDPLPCNCNVIPTGGHFELVKVPLYGYSLHLQSRLSRWTLLPFMMDSTKDHFELYKEDLTMVNFDIKKEDSNIIFNYVTKVRNIYLSKEFNNITHLHLHDKG